MMRDLIRIASGAAASLILSAGVAAAANWDVSCYETVDLGDTKVPEIESELYVLVDQTVAFDSALQKHAFRKVQGFLQPGRRVVLVSFSAYAKGRYAQIEWRGRLHRDLSEDQRYYIAKDTLEPLDACREKKQARMPRAMALGLKDIFDGHSDELPRSEIASNLARLGSLIVPRTRVSDDVHVLVVSDMMENSETISFYRSGSLRRLDPEKALSRVKEGGLLGDLSGMQVSVIGGAYSLREGYVSAEEIDALEDFWQRYIEESGGELAGFGRPRLEGKILR